MIGGWRGLHNEEFHNFYSLPSVKSKRMKLAGHAARMGERKTKPWVGE
jgi:hypothetical protein